MLSNELTKSGRQEACLKELQSSYKEIYNCFKKQKNKIFFTEKDFEESPDYEYIDNVTNSHVDYTETRDNWKLFPLYYHGGVKVQQTKHYQKLYSILDSFPNIASACIIVVKPHTQIGRHNDLEPGWRAHITLESGGPDTGLIYEDNGKKVQHSFTDGSLNIMQPRSNYHSGWNRNPKERVNLVVDFYNGRHANEIEIKKYIEEYNEVFYGLDNMHDFYEAKRIFGSQYTQTFAQFLEGDLKYAS
tara:strand:+ start:838 stop:1572 length:735 start_codon:yes stop_codon:yes gene_type:complete